MAHIVINGGYSKIIIKTHIEVWHPEELRTLCHSSGVSFPGCLCVFLYL